VYLIGSHDSILSEHGYARLGETFVILQMAPPGSWSLGSLVQHISKDW
jgi:hypothetical protein